MKSLASLHNLRGETVSKILKNVSPDGTVGRWPGWSVATFEIARKDYYANIKVNAENEAEVHSDGSDIHGLEKEIDEADLRVKIARAEALELDNAERRNTLVARKSVEDFFRFLMTCFAEKLRDLTRENHQDDLYNMLCEEIFKDIEGYVNERGIEHIITPEVIEEFDKIVDEEPIGDVVGNLEDWSNNEPNQ
jgi:hypothetical protein